MMQSVIETAYYLRAAKAAGMDGPEMTAVVDILAVNPEAGEIMQGCGGARKMRVARSGGGKSGGYRVITYFAGQNVPVFLLDAFAKNEKINLSKAERNELASLVKLLRASVSEG